MKIKRKDDTVEGQHKLFYCHNILPATAYQLFLHGFIDTLNDKTSLLVKRLALDQTSTI